MKKIFSINTKSFYLLAALYALSASGVSAQYCIGNTTYILRDEKGNKMSDEQVKKVVVKSINGVETTVEKDESGETVYKAKTASPDRRSRELYYRVNLKNPLQFGIEVCGQIGELTLRYDKQTMKLMLNVPHHNTNYEVDSLAFKKGVFQLERRKDATHLLACDDGKTPPPIDNQNTAVCRVLASNWKKVESQKQASK